MEYITYQEFMSQVNVEDTPVAPSRILEGYEDLARQTGRTTSLLINLPKGRLCYVICYSHGIADMMKRNLKELRPNDDLTKVVFVSDRELQFHWARGLRIDGDTPIYVDHLVMWMQTMRIGSQIDKRQFPALQAATSATGTLR